MGYRVVRFELANHTECCPNPYLDMPDTCRQAGFEIPQCKSFASMPILERESGQGSLLWRRTLWN